MSDRDVPLPERGQVRHPSAEYGRSRRDVPLHVFGPLERGTPLVLAAIHGNESETTVALSAAARMVAAGDLRCAFILAANPDGVLLGTRGNAAGVDLNRNFPAGDWESWTVVSHWSSQTTQVVELSTGDARGVRAGDAQRSSAWPSGSRRAGSSRVHSPIGAVLEPQASALGDWLVEHTGLPRWERVSYRTTGVLDSWAAEQGILALHARAAEDHARHGGRALRAGAGGAAPRRALTRLEETFRNSSGPHREAARSCGHARRDHHPRRGPRPLRRRRVRGDDLGGQPPALARRPPRDDLSAVGLALPDDRLAHDRRPPRADLERAR